MIFRKYGKTLHSVTPNFDPRAMNEIGFAKDGKQEISVEELESGYKSVATHNLVAQADGDVQKDVEQAVLDSLRSQMERIAADLEDGEILVIESEMGKDYPKMREKISKVVSGHENRLHFNRTIEPALRIGVYAPRTS